MADTRASRGGGVPRPPVVSGIPGVRWRDTVRLVGWTGRGFLYGARHGRGPGACIRPCWRSRGCRACAAAGRAGHRGSAPERQVLPDAGAGCRAGCGRAVRRLARHRAHGRGPGYRAWPGPASRGRAGPAAGRRRPGRHRARHCRQPWPGRQVCERAARPGRRRPRPGTRSPAAARTSRAERC